MAFPAYHTEEVQEDADAADSHRGIDARRPECLVFLAQTDHYQLLKRVVQHIDLVEAQDL